MYLHICEMYSAFQIKASHVQSLALSRVHFALRLVAERKDLKNVQHVQCDCERGCSAAIADVKCSFLVS